MMYGISAAHCEKKIYFFISRFNAYSFLWFYVLQALKYGTKDVLGEVSKTHDSIK